MEFTPEQRAYIDEQLRLSDEMQKRNGNKTYIIEEVFDNLLRDFEVIGDNYRL